MKAPTLRWGLVALLGLTLAQPVLAQDSPLVGSFDLTGKQGRRGTKVELRVERSSDGQLSFTRQARFTGARFQTTPPSTWTGTSASSGRTAVVIYRLPGAATARGLSGNLPGASAPANASGSNVLLSVYRLSADGQELSESIYNLTRRGDEAWWRTARTAGTRSAAARSDADIERAIEAAARGKLYLSEGDYPYTYVEAELAPGQAITEAVVRQKLARTVDGDPDADQPLASLFGETRPFSDWRQTRCEGEDDEDYCRAALDQVLAENLTDLQVFYFGRDGSPGRVDGVAVTIFVVGRSPSGKLMGVRTIAIWT